MKAMASKRSTIARLARRASRTTGMNWKSTNSFQTWNVVTKKS